MRIAFILDETWDSALTHYAYGIYESLSKNHETYLLCLKDSYIDKKHKSQKIYIKKLRNKNPIKSFFSFKYLAKELRKINPDAVFTILGDAAFFSCLLKKRLGFSLIRIFGENKLLRTPRECIDDIILPADFLRKRVDIKKINNRILTFKGFVDTQKFAFNPEGRKRIRTIYGIEENEILFGSVGRLDEIKGYKILINAFSQMPKNTKLMIVGEEKGLSAADLKHISDNQGLNDRIIIINERRSDIVDIMGAFDIGVISSIGSEVIARVLFEFMSMGLPIVTTDIGMLREAADKDFSILCKPDEESLLQAMETIITKDLKEMGKKAKTASSRYSIKAFSESIVSTIE